MRVAHQHRDVVVAQHRRRRRRQRQPDGRDEPAAQDVPTATLTAVATAALTMSGAVSTTAVKLYATNCDTSRTARASGGINTIRGW
jgi:hypothetical protein